MKRRSAPRSRPFGGTAAAAAHHLAEYILENIGKAAAAKAAAKTAAAAAVFERGMAKPVVGRALLRIAQRLIGFVQFLELGLSRCIARIAVRMILHGKLAKGGFQILLVRRFGNAKRLVKISLHGSTRSRKSHCHADYWTRLVRAI